MHDSRTTPKEQRHITGPIYLSPDMHCRIAVGLAVPAGTVRGWIRVRQSASRLRVTGIRAVLASGSTICCPGRALTSRAARWSTWRPSALVLGRSHGLEQTSWWARIDVLTCGRLTMAPLAKLKGKRWLLPLEDLEAYLHAPDCSAGRGPGGPPANAGRSPLVHPRNSHAAVHRRNST